MTWLMSLFTGGSSTWIIAAIGAAIIAIGSAYAMHHWDQVAYLKLQNSYNTAIANQAQLSTSLDTCNASIKDYAARSKAALEQKQRLIDLAQEDQRKAEDKVKWLLAHKLPPGSDACKAAFDLAKETIH